MKRGYNTNRIYQVRCKSGLKGFRCRLQCNYGSFSEWETYGEMWGLVKRLGYKSAKSAWLSNPIVEGSVNPADYRKIS